MNLLEMLIKAESNKSVEPLEDYDFPEVEDVNINNEKLIMTLADMVAKAYAKIPKAGPKENNMKKLTREKVISRLEEAKQQGKRPNFSYMNLSGLDLSGLDFLRADFTYAILTRADLTNANLDYADLTNANLDYVDLTDANLEGAKGI